MIKELKTVLAEVAADLPEADKHDAAHWLSCALCPISRHDAASRTIESLRRFHATPTKDDQGKLIEDETRLWEAAINGLVQLFLGDRMESRRDAITCLSQIADKSRFARQYVMDVMARHGVHMRIRWETNGFDPCRPVFEYSQTNSRDSLAAMRGALPAMAWLTVPDDAAGLVPEDKRTTRKEGVLEPSTV
ncbi:unnamed protein product [Pedinophyceae sp. YPF-701]|nr:unnamed protein product [Pedinophyceae sp. YPF-701]